ncbi:hypothetical protein ACR78H_07445 [Sphingobacterium siyangense]|uniref:hypothetical protein n=1 Tax=Sphingobacterium siyangense TaxID=459529 RepID=UPI003DA64038
MNLRFLFFLLVILISACSTKPSRLELALQKAGKNRTELEKVINKYSEDPIDSLKRRSVIFLIENMDGYFSYEGKSMSDYKNYFKCLRHSNQTPETILDSISNLYGFFDLNKSKKLYDLETVDSTFLVENIELAFTAWKNFPWSKNYSFGEFCEYILPYRVENESLSDWRKLLYNEYYPMVKSLKSKDPIEVAMILRDSAISRNGVPRFTMTRPANYPSLDVLTSRSLAGTCDDLAQFSMALFRTFGIVCSKDFIPLQGAENFGHSWVFLKNHKQEFFHTDFFDPIIYITETVGNRTIMKTKVYRRKFSKNWEDIEMIKNELDFIPSEFQEGGLRFEDVTPLYSNNLTDLNMTNKDLYEKISFSQSKIAFLCAPAWLDWKPIAWTKIDEDGNASFKNIDAGSLLRVAQMDGETLKFISAPFFIHKQNRSKIFFNGIGEKENISLYSKFNLDRDRWAQDRIIGGIIEAANNRTFEKADTLYIFKKRPFRLSTEVICNSSPNKYKYIRYKGAPGTHCNIAEIAFFSNDKRLSGKVIGQPGSWNNNESFNYTAAMDGSTLTAYDFNQPDGGWVGLELSENSEITKVQLTPRNYDNYIKPDNDYELFVDSPHGWKSFGRKKARADSLVFQNVPYNALLYLKNHTYGRDERVFYIENGIQVFK